MSMTKSLFAAAAFMLFTSVSALAADTVNFTMKASMPSLRDTTKKDNFTVGLADKQVDTTLKITCQGATAGLISGQNESCAVTGNGALVNPANGQKLQRTQYAGGWVVKSDGFTDGTSMSVNYLALGKVAASNGNFAGSMMLKPENPSTGASLLRDTILKKIKTTESGPDRRAGGYHPAFQFHHSLGGASFRQGLRVERQLRLFLPDRILVHRSHRQVQRQGLSAERQHALHRNAQCRQPAPV